ncbi:hypothetical protein V9T40_004565 [Parthenolecanium corni]|uniref:Uncharacterized protein n=1 Tax=Parthenolecanium corni TaxID=536013 RepID=A0AAN9YAV3_9HEMI
MTSSLANRVNRLYSTAESEDTFFVQLSQFSSRCPKFLPDVSILVQMSHFSTSCLNFRLDVSFFVQLSQFSFISLARLLAQF